MSPIHTRNDRYLALAAVVINVFSLSIFLLDLDTLRSSPNPYFPRTWIVLFVDVDVFQFWQYFLIRSAVVLPWTALSAHSVIQQRMLLSAVFAILSLIGTFSNTFVLYVTSYR